MSDRLIAVVQARIKSTRLPAKTMLLLPNGKAVVHEVLDRCRKIHGITEIIAAIPDTEDCLVLSAHINDIARNAFPVTVVSGSEDDVLSRFLVAAKSVNVTDSDSLIRITADCPLLDPSVVGATISKFRADNLDYCSNVHPRTFPHGFDCEALTGKALYRADAEATSLYDREHVTPYIYKHPDKFKCGGFTQTKNEANIRLTLDTVDDYIAICRNMMESKL
jgi:spore coat polysaccharide biosynthesis protein SpsF (cytidylyltransferase family)